jgi:hypothetical protein
LAPDLPEETFAPLKFPFGLDSVDNMAARRFHEAGNNSHNIPAQAVLSISQSIRGLQVVGPKRGNMKVTNALIGALAAFAVCSSAMGQPSDKLEKGRIRICMDRGEDAPKAARIVEIPLGGNFQIPPAKGSTEKPVSIAQTNFPAPASPGAKPVIVTPDGYTVNIEEKDGIAVARIDLAEHGCVYLDSMGPAFDTQNVSYSASDLVPEWKAPAAKVAPATSYAYFTSVEPTWYIDSEVGKGLQYVIHDADTGSYVHRDRMNNVAVDNDMIRSSVAKQFRRELAGLHQYDFNILQSAEFAATLQSGDLKKDANLASVLAQFKKNVKPQPGSRLIVVVPLRQPVTVEYSNATIYGSKVEGLGFYVDYRIGTESTQNGSGTGSFDVFLNCRAAVVDVDSGNILAVRDFVGGHVFSAARSPNGNVFDSLTGLEMFNAVNSVVHQGVSRIVSDIFVAKK